MSPNVKTRKYLQSLPTRSNLLELISEVNIDSIDVQIMHLRYIEHKEWDYIADILGYSESAVKRRHSKILTKISKII